MSLYFGIVERRCDHIAIKRAICGRGFFLVFDFFLFLRIFLPLPLLS